MTFLLQFLVLLVLTSIFASDDDASVTAYSGVIVLSPRNNTIVGSRIYFAIDATEILANGNGSKWAEIKPSEILIRLICKNRILLESPFSSSIFKFFIDDFDLFDLGKNIFTLELSDLRIGKDNNYNGSVISLAMILYSLKQSRDAKFDAIMGFMQPSALRWRSYALFGFTTSTNSFISPSSSWSHNMFLAEHATDWSQFVALDGDRYEVFYNDKEKNGDGLCSLLESSSRITHCIPLKDIQQRIAGVVNVDYSVILLEELMALASCETTTTSTTENCGSAPLNRLGRRRINEYINKIIRISRVGVIVFSMTHNAAATRFISTFVMKCYTGERYFTKPEFNFRNDMNPSSSSSGTLGGDKKIFGMYDMWFLDTKLAVTMSSPFLQEVVAIEQGSDVITTREIMKPSQLLMNSFQPTRSFMLLSNVCLMKASNTIVLFNTNLTQPIVDMEFLAAEEDRGFLYSGLRFV